MTEVPIKVAVQYSHKFVITPDNTAGSRERAGFIEAPDSLRNLLPLLDDRFRYAVEVRHQSWFQDLAYNFFADNDICMVWSQLARIRTPPIVTSDFLYVRFIGDRSIDEKDFGKIQKDRVSEMNKWADEIKQVEKGHLRGKIKKSVLR